jgi:hypothetical protein
VPCLTPPLQQNMIVRLQHCVDYASNRTASVSYQDECRLASSGTYDSQLEFPASHRFI